MIGTIAVLPGIRRTIGVVAAGTFALVTLLAPDVRAQGSATTVDPIATQTEIAANPDFNVASLWRSLKIPPELDTVYAKVGVPNLASRAASFDRCENACLAEIARANVDDDPGLEVILTVYQEGKRCRFLLFKSSASSSGAIAWRFLGYADHDDLGQYDPEYRVAVMGGRRYFVVSVSGMRGTGLWVHYDRWYEVGQAGLREVLSLPADGVECEDARSLCRAYGSTVVSTSSGTRGEQFVVSFAVRYWGDEFLIDEKRSGEIPLFARTQKAVYARPLKSSERYALAPLDSDIATWELDTAFRPEGLRCQDFLVSNSDNLKQIASARATDARTWLARYVATCTASPERTEFLDLLAK